MKIEGSVRAFLFHTNSEAFPKETFSPTTKACWGLEIVPW